MDAIIRRRDKDILPGEWTWVLFHNVEQAVDNTSLITVLTAAGHLFTFTSRKYALRVSHGNH